MQAPRKEEKAGLYLTLIVHLGALIVLLAIQIGRELSHEERFEMDFSREEQLEEQAARQQLEEEVDRRIEERLKNYQPKASDLKNLAVDAGALKDDRGGESREGGCGEGRAGEGGEGGRRARRGRAEEA